MVLRAATKDENVPRPRTFIIVAARDDRDEAALLWRTFSSRTTYGPDAADAHARLGSVPMSNG